MPGRRVFENVFHQQLVLRHALHRLDEFAAERVDITLLPEHGGAEAAKECVNSALVTGFLFLIKYSLENIISRAEIGAVPTQFHIHMVEMCVYDETITIATLIQRKMEINREKEKLPLDQTIFYQSIATALALALPAILVEDLKTDWVPEFNYTLLWLILAVSLGAYILMWQLIERLDTTKVASLFYLGPPITMLMAWIAFGDKVKLMDIVGMGVVFIGVFLTQLKKDKRY